VINTPQDLGVVAQAARRRAGASQSEVALRAGVSRQWIGAFEAGHPRAELAIVLQVLAVLGLETNIEVALETG
jgi:HTH-type transcriptional regulator / antitoxin HipB